MKKISFIFITLLLTFISTIIFLEISIKIYKQYFANDQKVVFYVLGGSTSYGEPFYDNPSFIRLINKKLDGRFNNKPIDIVMLASPGKNLISNYLSLAKELITNPYEEAYIFVYMGINENHINEYGAAYNLFENFILNFQIGPIILDYFLPQTFNQLPNSEDLFRKRYEKFLNFASNNSKKVFLSSLAGNYHEYQPSFSDYKYKNIANLFQCESIENYKDRLECFIKLKVKPEFVSYLIKQLLFKRSGDIVHLRQMKKHWNKFESHVPSESKNSFIKALAKKHHNVFYIPFHEEVKKASNGHIGFNFFVDAHHPNLNTMLIMSNLFLSSLVSDKSLISMNDVENWFYPSHREKSVGYNRLQWFFWESLFDYVSFSKARMYFNHLKKVEYLFESNEKQFFYCLLYLIGPNFKEGKCKEGHILDNYDKSLIRDFFERDFVKDKLNTFNKLYLGQGIINQERYLKIKKIIQ